MSKVNHEPDNLSILQKNVEKLSEIIFNSINTLSKDSPKLKTGELKEEHLNDFVNSTTDDFVSTLERCVDLVDNIEYISPEFFTNENENESLVKINKQIDCLEELKEDVDARLSTMIEKSNPSLKK